MCKTNIEGKVCNVSRDIINALSHQQLTKDDFFELEDQLTAIQVLNNADLGGCLTYKKHIESLVHSKHEFDRLCAYRFIGVAKDATFNALLQERLNSNESVLLKTWTASALMENRCDEASDEIFKFLSSGSPGIPVNIFINQYIELSQAAVLKTCWTFIDSENKSEQIMALQCLAHLKPDTKLQAKLKGMLKEWDPPYKGWVISAMMLQKMGNLKPLLSEYLHIERLKGFIINVLEKSPTEADRLYAEELKSGQ